MLHRFKARCVLCIVVLCIWVSWLAGCAGETLDYDTALNLLRDRRADTVKITFSATPAIGQGDPKLKEAYDRLIAEHVLTCEANAAVGTLCQAGPAGAGIRQEGSTDLSLIAGQWVPSVITSISRSARGTAQAEARLTFEPSPLYREYQELFDTLQSSAEAHLSVTERREGRGLKITYVRADDGWHVDAVN